MLLSSLHKKQRRAFSLIELLVVIGIIAILAAIAFPVLGNMSKKGKATESANNMRQWGQALLLFVAENDGALPYEGSRDNFSWANLAVATSGDNRGWFNVLPPYAEMKPMKDLATIQERQFHTLESGIHRCPLVKFTDHRRPTFSYMMNSQIWSGDNPYYDPSIPAAQEFKQNVRMIQIPRPAFTVIFADANVTTTAAGEVNDRARGRGRHVSDRQPGNVTNLMMMDGSMRSFSANDLREDNFIGPDGFAYTDNNRPDVVWNPWRGHPTAP